MGIPIVGPFLMIGEGLHEGMARVIADSAHAKEIGTKVELSSVEDKIVQAFTTPLKKASCFDRVDYIKNKVITPAKPEA